MTDEAPLSFTFQISGKALEVAKAGEIELVQEIEFTAPTSRNLKESSQLKQALSRAMFEAQEKAGDTTAAVSSGKDTKITGKDIMQALTFSSVPLEDVLAVGHKLLTSGVGTVAGGVKFNALMCANLSLDDMERMVGDYAVNFCLRSILN